MHGELHVLRQHPRVDGTLRLGEEHLSDIVGDVLGRVTGQVRRHDRLDGVEILCAVVELVAHAFQQLVPDQPVELRCAGRIMRVSNEKRKRSRVCMGYRTNGAEYVKCLNFDGNGRLNKSKWPPEF